MTENKIFDFTIYYNRHKVQLYRYILKITRSTMIAEDIVHDTFVKFYDNMHAIADADKIEQWLFKVARNEAMRHFRIQKTRKEDGIENAEEADDAISDSLRAVMPDSEYEKTEMRLIMETELAAMIPEQSEVYRLKELSGLNYRQIAEVLDISEDLVRSRLFKARQKLITAIKEMIQ